MHKPEALTWVEISRAALTHNVAEFRKLVGEDRLVAGVVKANAYGHGIREVARILLQAGVDWLAVHSLDEGLALRGAGIDSPIILLGYVPLADLREAVERELRITVYNCETVEKLGTITDELGKRSYLHLKLETGTQRQGLLEEDIPGLIEILRSHRNLILEGLSTHFANIEDTTDHSYAKGQLGEFVRLSERIEENGVSVPIRHAACTAAALLFPETYFQMVRLGIGLYGLWPSKETYVSGLEKGDEMPDLRPVLTWKTRIAQLKTIPRGSYVGYGCTYRTTRRTRLAVLPLGYYEGYPRALSNVGRVLVRGVRAPIRGRVCMNNFMVDVTDIPEAVLEEEVVLLGRQGDEVISAESLAGMVGSINYEIVARINPMLPRVVVE